MSPARRKKPLSGWGRYPVLHCEVAHPRSLRELRALLTDNRAAPVIARGLGRSYGDSSLEDRGTVLVQTERNRFLGFDDQTGILACEAGVSLGEIIGHFLPRGWALPITPGTKHVTIGGAIAADVHGKNHHGAGSFGGFVRDLRLLVANGDVVDCSPTENRDVFWATVGGMGLTGIVLDARLELRRVETAYCKMSMRRARNLDESLELFSEMDRQARYSVAWIDCLSKGRSLGRSVVMLANDAAIQDLPARRRRRPLAIGRSSRMVVPVDMPAFVLNPWCMRAFNALYYSTHGDRESIISYEAYFYPLDRLRAWNRVYGKRGFIQYQALFPRETSRRGLIELLELVSASGRASFLAVLKASGPRGDGLMSFLSPGHTIALDLVNTGNDLMTLTRAMDAIVVRHGGRIYLAKDSTTTPEAFAAMYPEAVRFRRVKERIDPNHCFMSAQARRLGLFDEA